MRYQTPKGTKDVLPNEIGNWQWLESEFRSHLHHFGYREVRTPAFEDAELFERTAGDTSEIVTKQMFKFEDLGGRMVALKPESTAPVMRMLVQAGLAAPGVVHRLGYVSSPHFRYEQPGKGRYRQHHQCGIELVGVSSPRADAEVIEFLVTYLRRVGIEGTKVSLNSLGREDCRARYRVAVETHFGDWIARQSEEDAARARRNPLRLLDAKDAELRSLAETAPSILDHLEPECDERFAALQTLLGEAGIEFDVDPRIVRGLDYYTETVFEVLMQDGLGAHTAVGAGGRYDNLIQEVGGPSIPSVGFGMGMERLLLVLEAQGKLPESSPTQVFAVAQSDVARSEVASMVRALRAAGVSAVYDLEGTSLRSQMRQADKVEARYVLVLGEDEVAQGTVSVKTMATGEQRVVPRGDLLEVLR